MRRSQIEKDVPAPGNPGQPVRGPGQELGWGWEVPGGLPCRRRNSSHQGCRRNPPLFPSVARPLACALTPKANETLGESLTTQSPEPGPAHQIPAMLTLNRTSPSAWPCNLSPGPRITGHLSLWPLQGRFGKRFCALVMPPPSWACPCLTDTPAQALLLWPLGLPPSFPHLQQVPPPGPLPGPSAPASVPACHSPVRRHQDTL